MDSSDTPPLLVLGAVVLVLALANRSASYLFVTLIDGARRIPRPACCFFAALRSLLYVSLEGGRGGATDRLLGTGGEGSFMLGGGVSIVGVGVVFFGRLVRGGTGGIGLLGAPRLGVLGDCGATAVLVGGAESVLSVEGIRIV